MSNFETISNFFHIDGVGLYVGRVIASRDEVYLAAGLAPFNLRSLFSGSLVKQLSGNQGPLNVPLSELPEAVIRDPSWPINSTDGFVCVLKRDSLSDIRCSFLGNLRLSTSEHTAIIQSGLIKRFAMLRILRRFGWPV